LPLGTRKATTSMFGGRKKSRTAGVTEGKNAAAEASKNGGTDAPPKASIFSVLCDCAWFRNAHDNFKALDHDHVAHYKTLESDLSEGQADIYSISAIVDDPIVTFLAFVCATIQLVATPLVVLAAFTDSEKPVCYGDDPMNDRVVATVFAVYVAVHQFKTFSDLTNRKLLRLALGTNENPPRVLERDVVGYAFYYGVAINTVSAAFVTLGAIALIYHAETPTDVLLNSLAMYFINDLDNDLVFNSWRSSAMKRISLVTSFRVNAQTEPAPLMVQFVLRFSFLLLIAVTIGVVLAPVYMFVCF